MEIDVNQFLTVLASGGAVWAGIRIEIKYLRRDVDRVLKRVAALEKA